VINPLERYRVCIQCPYRIKTELPKVFICFRSMAYLNLVINKESYKCPDNRWSEEYINV